MVWGRCGPEFNIKRLFRSGWSHRPPPAIQLGSVSRSRVSFSGRAVDAAPDFNLNPTDATADFRINPMLCFGAVASTRVSQKGGNVSGPVAPFLAGVAPTSYFKIKPISFRLGRIGPRFQKGGSRFLLGGIAFGSVSMRPQF